MKIELIYKEPGTQIKAYFNRSLYDEEEVEEACAELQGARDAGYEIVAFRLMHDEDVTYY